MRLSGSFVPLNWGKSSRNVSTVSAMAQAS
jgi:hypothetical protein